MRSSSLTRTRASRRESNVTRIGFPCTALSVVVAAAVLLFGISTSRSFPEAASRIKVPAEAGAEAEAEPEAMLRSVKKFLPGQKVMEGGGVPVYRTIGTSNMRNLDPFLMLDEFKSPSKDAEMGFPDHPHRGFETCTIMLKGRVEHEDHVGNKGMIGPGGVQWMTAGRGIVHSEFPKSKGDEMLWGFQLWVNLAAKDKMCQPKYQDYQADRIPVFEGEGYSVRVLSGQHGDAQGPIVLKNPGLLFDVRLEEPGTTFEHSFPEEWNSFAYVYEQEGNATLCGQAPKMRHSHIFDNAGSLLKASTEAAEGSKLKFLLFAGRPIRERIVQYGPFVMNTEEEIDQAFRDFRSGKLQDPQVEIVH